jgi:hypothetical protein
MRVPYLPKKCSHFVDGAGGAKIRLKPDVVARRKQ